MQITTTIDTDLAPADLWRVFGEGFEHVSDWAHSIVASSLDSPLAVGAVRTCDLKATGPVVAGKVTERLTVFDPSARALTYVVTSGIPGFMRHLDNAWTFEALPSGGTRVTSAIKLEMAWWSMPMAPMVRSQLSKAVRGFIEQLEAYVGDPARHSGARAA